MTSSLYLRYGKRKKATIPYVYLSNLGRVGR